MCLFDTLLVLSPAIASSSRFLENVLGFFGGCRYAVRFKEKVG